MAPRFENQEFENKFENQEEAAKPLMPDDSPIERADKIMYAHRNKEEIVHDDFYHTYKRPASKDLKFAQESYEKSGDKVKAEETKKEWEKASMDEFIQESRIRFAEDLGSVGS